MSIVIFLLNVGIFILNFILAEVVATIITFCMMSVIYLLNKVMKKEVPEKVAKMFVIVQACITIGLLVLFLSGHGIPYR